MAIPDELAAIRGAATNIAQSGLANDNKAILLDAIGNRFRLVARKFREKAEREALSDTDINAEITDQLSGFVPEEEV